MLSTIIQMTAAQAILLSLGFLLVYVIANNFHQRLRIHRKGSFGATYQTKLPFGLDFIYSAVSSQLKDQDILFWDRLFRSHANPHRPYTVEVNAAGRRLIYTADPDNIKAILSAQFDDYGKGRWLSKEWRALFGHSILATDGKLWQDGRKMIRAQLSKERISDLTSLEEYTKSVVSALESAGGAAIDVKSLFAKFTLDHGTKFLLGESTDTMGGNLEGTRFGTALDECQRFVILQATAGKVGKLMSKATFRDNLRTVNAFVDVLVRRALELTHEELQDAANNNSFNLAYALVEHTRDPVMLRDQLLAVLIGARDTTACCLSWLFYALSQNTEVLKELRAEILERIGNGRAPTYSELKDMTYLQDTIKETLRLYPSVPYDIRWALKDCSLPRGAGADGSEPIGVLQSTPVIYSIQYLHLSEEFHESIEANAPDLCSFAPHRWRTWRPKHWTYLPFNGGPRLCVGQQFALTEIAYVVVRILQRFESVSWMGDKRPVYKDASLSGRSAIERFLMNQRVGMHSEIVLAPDGEVNLSFV